MRRSEKLEKKCVVEGCGRKHKAFGFCMGHYLRFREGRPFETPLTKNNKKLDLTVGSGTTVSGRVSLQARAVLTALAEQEGQSFYVYMSELLEAHAEERQATVDFQGHLARLAQAAEKREGDQASQRC